MTFDSGLVALQERFQQLIAQPLERPTGLGLGVLSHTVHIVGEAVQGFCDLLAQFINGLAQGGKHGLLLLLLLTGHDRKLLPELVEFFFNMVSLALVFQGKLQFQRFETRLEVVLEHLHRSREPLGLYVGRKWWQVAHSVQRSCVYG